MLYKIFLHGIFPFRSPCWAWEQCKNSGKCFLAFVQSFSSICVVNKTSQMLWLNFMAKLVFNLVLRVFCILKLYLFNHMNYYLLLLNYSLIINLCRFSNLAFHFYNGVLNEERTYMLIHNSLNMEKYNSCNKCPML